MVDTAEKREVKDHGMHYYNYFLSSVIGTSMSTLLGLSLSVFLSVCRKNVKNLENVLRA